MQIITRVEAIQNLKKFIGEDLAKQALKYGITIYKNGKQNKGWKGLVLERLAGLDNNNIKAPNGNTFEVKSVACHYVNDVLVPKETMAITMLNQQELIDTPFFESHCWKKLRSLIFCAVMWHGKNSETGELLKVVSFDFIDEKMIKEIGEDYEFIRRKLIEQGYKSLTGADGKWIQARTKGAGHGSTSRAFYARPALIKTILNSNLTSGWV